ncbi:hypothetical protein SDJN02_04851, partial [Cucurbita argyrosperma subsp. argyrosperma]
MIRKQDSAFNSQRRILTAQRTVKGRLASGSRQTGESRGRGIENWPERRRRNRKPPSRREEQEKSKEEEAKKQRSPSKELNLRARPGKPLPLPPLLFPIH